MLTIQILGAIAAAVSAICSVLVWRYAC